MTTANATQISTGNENSWPRVDLFHLIFVALLFALGAEMLRLFMSGMVFYLREAREFSTVQVGGTALLCFMGALLGPVLARGIEPSRLLQLCAFGILIDRIVIQFVEVAAFDFVLSIVGTVLFLWAIPASASMASTRGRIAGGTWLLGLLTASPWTRR